MLTFLLGLMLSGLISGLAYRRESLSRTGVLGAMLLGTSAVMAGWQWAVIIIAFFMTSSALSKVGERRKAHARTYFSKSEQRDFMQVMANGGIAWLITCLYLLTDDTRLWAAYLGAYAVATADTWGTEIGTLSQGRPRLLTTFQPTEPGQSGAVSPLGTGAAFLGALLIGSIGTAFPIDTPHNTPLIFWLMIALAGWGGSLLDSLFGATFQALYWCADTARLTERRICADGTPATLRQGWAWVTNDVINFLSVSAGALLAFLALP